MSQTENRRVVVCLVMNGRLKKFVSIEEGALLYSVGKNTFREMATDAQALYRIKRRVLVNLQKMDEYMELFAEDNRLRDPLQQVRLRIIEVL